MADIENAHNVNWENVVHIYVARYGFERSYQPTSCSFFTPSRYRAYLSSRISKQESVDMSSPTLSPYNYSLHSVPAAFLLGIVPQGYMLARLMVATRGKMSNAMSEKPLITTFLLFPFWLAMTLQAPHQPRNLAKHPLKPTLEPLSPSSRCPSKFNGSVSLVCCCDGKSTHPPTRIL